MEPIFDHLPPEQALETQQLARLIYETREHRRQVLDATGAATEDELLARVARGEIAEHPAYEHYLAARILADTHQAARAAMAQALKEASRR
jgi:chromosome condensin MukBEF complex kleisin-like MukF subunit